MSLFNNIEDPSYLKFKHRVLKSRRHKTWTKKAREKGQKNTKEHVEKLAALNKTIDEWQARVNNEYELRRKAEEEKKKRLQELREEKQLDLAANHFSEVLLKLEELRSLRATNMELEGQSAPNTPSLYEILKGYLKDHPIEEKKKKKVAPVKDLTVAAPQSTTDVEAAAAAAAVEEGAAATNGAPAPPRNLMTEDIVEAYYTQATKSLENLVVIRGGWDIFITRIGGTRIPRGWVKPPPPAHGWEKFLIKKKRVKKSRKNNNNNNNNENNNSNNNDNNETSTTSNIDLFE